MSPRTQGKGRKNPSSGETAAASPDGKNKERSERPVRLDKLLAQEGLGTRSELGKAIRSGRALVNGKTEKDPGRKVTTADEVCFDGKNIGRAVYVYYMLHKPAGVITATEDGSMRTVLDLLREPDQASAQGNESMPVQSVLRRGLFPVGRLDRDTEGLLLITDDGQLAHRLLSPARHVDKTYYALVRGIVTEEDVRLFAEGLRVDKDLTAMPAMLRIVDPAAENGIPGNTLDPAEGTGTSGKVLDQTAADGTNGNAADLAGLIPRDPGRILPPEITEYTHTVVTIHEGKYHQIKRMFEAVGKEVIYLKRLSMGPLYLDAGLAPGQFRPLTQEEIAALRGIYAE